jgi:toxin ParE1/3/4
MTDHFRISVTRRASRDLIGIHEYINQNSPQNAVSVLERLFADIDSLEYLPHRCKVHRDDRNANRVVRSMVAPPFIIYYRILENEQIVEVLAVLHGARRQPRSFD